MRWLSQQGFQFPDYPRDTDMRPCAFYGFDTKPFVRIVGIEAMLGGVNVPTGFWYMNEECFSPYEMLVEAERRKVFSLSAVCKFAAVSCAPDYETHVGPVEDARIAAELSIRFGLYPFDSATTNLLVSVIEDHLQQPVEAAESEPGPESEPGVSAEEEDEYEEVEEEVEVAEDEEGDELEEDEEYEEVEEEVEVAEGEEGDGEYEYDEEEVEVTEESAAPESPGKRLVPRTRRGEE